MEEVCEGKEFSFPGEEEKVTEFWNSIDAFKEQLRRSEGKPEFVFYDGPPFATGLPHYGHLLAGTIKDTVTRYATATGHHCVRRFGWDCHGLPVEYEIDKKLGIKTREDVLKMGIDKYNEACRSIVMTYSKEWEVTVKRLGRWIDFENDYKTLDPEFMESVWWVFSQLWEKGLVYKGFKVMPYSTGCSTPLSNFEAGQNYKEVDDPAVMVSFPLDGDVDDASLVAWTTTPWTLPSNLALCVNPDLDYVRARDPETGRVYIVAEVLLEKFPPNNKKGKKKFEVVAKCKGSELVGKSYEPLFPYFAHLKKPDGAFRVMSDAYVTATDGTGVVHTAPAFGEDDYRVCLAHGIIAKGEGVPCPVDSSGCFTEEVTDFAGRYVKDADKDIIKALRAAGRLVDAGTLRHQYPFCWRSDTPLIYKAVPSWFVRVEAIKDRLLANNTQTSWVPAYVQEKRFHNWLENAHDWAISRSRFWGTPLPIWASEDGEEVVAIGSRAELEELTGEKVTDMHRHFIDHLTIPSRQGKGVLRRVDEVFDCWFESGSMPYAYIHYPFENKEFFQENFPADFVAEGLDQTRGWFYTLMVLSTALFDKPAFKNLVCNGLVLAADGKKMSKRLKNYPDPTEILDKYGADALRLYLINSPVVRAETLKFKEEGVFGVIKDVFLPWYNAYRFLVQNVLRLEAESGKRFWPQQVDLASASNVLDRWINAAARSLTAFVAAEMGAYRLYTVVPYLVKFIDSLTNVYVRYNRRRLKGRSGAQDCSLALASLFDVLLTVCKVMAPFTPYFAEVMYRNLRRALPEGSPESVHFCDFPAAAAAQEGDDIIQQSVEGMQRVIEAARTIRERQKRPTKMPLRGLTIVHPDRAFLDELMGELAEYVRSEVNVQHLEACPDPLQFASIRAQPDFKLLGKRMGKAMAAAKKEIEALTTEQILAYEAAGQLQLAGGAVIQAGEIKVLRDFKAPEGTQPEDLDACGDGELLVVLDLRADEGLAEQGAAREVVNRIQKLRKHAGLVASDPVDIYVGPTSAENGGGELAALLERQAGYIAESLGAATRPLASLQPHAVVWARESATVVGAELEVVLTVPAVTLVHEQLLQAANGNEMAATGAAAWLASRDPKLLAEEAAAGSVTVHLDGSQLVLKPGCHFHLPGSAGPTANGLA